MKLWSLPAILCYFLVMSHLHDTTAAVAWSAVDIPDPVTDFQRCGRTESSNLCNPDGVISKEAAIRVDKIINGLQTFTIHCGLNKDERPFQLGVAVIERLYGTDVSLDDMERAAKAIHDRWGVGHRACNNGILFLLSKLDRKMYISTGKGARVFLSDRRIGEIIDDTKPFCRRNDFDKAVEFAVRSIVDSLRQQHKAFGPGGPSRLSRFFTALSDFITDYLPLVGLVAIIGGSLIYNARKNRRETTRRAHIQKVLRELQGLRHHGPTYRTSICPICLDDLTPTHKLLLPCGHEYHEKCMQEWLELNSTCPVCREPVPGVRPTVRRPPPPPRQPDTGLPHDDTFTHDAGAGSSHPPSDDSCARSAQQARPPENREYFDRALGRLGMRHPDLIDDFVIRQWWLYNLTRAPLYEPVLRAPPPPPPSSGFSSSSSSWGGGSSFGGGGGGGSW